MRKTMLFSIAVLVILGVALPVTASVTGLVITADNEPLPVSAARITAYPTETRDAAVRRLLSAHPDPIPTATATTAADGRFTIDVKTPVARIRIENAKGSSIEVDAGGNDDLGAIVLPSDPPRSLVLTSNGKPVVNATIGLGSLVTHSDAEGKFTLPYKWSSEPLFLHPDYAPREGVEQTSDWRTVQLSPGVLVQGVVQNERGDASVQGALVFVDGWLQATTGDDGRFSIPHVPEDWTTLFLTNGAMSAGVSRIANGPYVVRLQPSGSVSGVVIDKGRGAPVAGATVNLSGGPMTMTAIADARGAFSFRGVLPGPYGLDVGHPSYSGESQAVVSRSKEVTVTIAVVASASVSGTVLDERGKPLSGAMLSTQYMGSQGAGGSSVALSAADGTFTLPNVGGSGRLSVAAVKKGYVSSQARDIATTPGQRTRGVVVKMPLGFQAVVKVVDKDGKPVAGADISFFQWRDQAGKEKDIFCAAGASRGHCAQTAADGTVSFRAETGRMYDVEVSGADFEESLTGQMVSPNAPTLKVVVERVVSGSSSDPDWRPTNLTGRSEEPSGQVTGKVTDAQSRRPIADFVVFILSPGGSVPESRGDHPQPPFQHSSDGSFVLNNIPPGPADLVVVAPGYMVERRGDVNVADRKTATGVEVELTRGRTLTGRIHGPDNAPLSGVTVSIERIDGVQRDGSNLATTDAEGQFVLGGLAPGQKILHFDRDGYPATRRMVAIMDVDTHIEAELVRGRDLLGRVVDESGRAVQGARIVATAPFTSSTAVSDAAGSFKLMSVGQGSYALTATKEGYVDTMLSGVEGPTAQKLSLVLKRGGTITGHVLGLKASDEGHLSVTVQGDGGLRQSEVDRSGSFVVQGLPDGSFSIYAGNGPNRETSPKTVTVANGTSAPVELEFASVSVMLHGRVTRNGSPLARATVHTSRPDGSSREVLTAADGTYEIRDLLPGDYSVFVMPATPDGRGAQMAEGARVAVASSGSVYDRDFTDATVRGRVVDANRQPVAGVVVGFGGPMGPQLGSTDSEGRFAIEHASGGKIQVVARKIGYAPSIRQVSITNGSAPDVEFTLAAAQAVLVRVVDARNNSLLDPFMVVSDSSNRPVESSHGSRANDGSEQLSLQAGDYQMTVSATGYVSQNLKISVPGPPVEVRLSRAGSVSVSYSGTTSLRAELDDAGGKRAGSILLTAGRTSPISGLAPGPYVLRVLDANGKTLQTYPVQVVEGQAAPIAVR